MHSDVRPDGCLVLIAEKWKICGSAKDYGASPSAFWKGIPKPDFRYSTRILSAWQVKLRFQEPVEVFSQ